MKKQNSHFCQLKPKAPGWRGRKVNLTCNTHHHSPPPVQPLNIRLSHCTRNVQANKNLPEQTTNAGVSSLKLVTHISEGIYRCLE
jgi:hypothetical protein